MESHNFFSQFDTVDIPIQIIKLKNSFFIYVGTPQLQFENLNVSIPSDEMSLANTISILDDEFSEVGKSLAYKLSNS
jgi:hypothetical protein